MIEIEKNNTKTISYKPKLIGSTRYISISLYSLVDTFAEGIHKVKCKHRYDNKKCKYCGIRWKDCKCFFNTHTLKMI